jgi:hypothetical protein
MKKQIKKSNPSSKFDNLKGAGIRSSYSSEVSEPEMISAPQRKSVAPRAMKIADRTEKKAANATAKIDKTVSKATAKSDKLSAKSKIAAAKGKTRRANVLESRSKLNKPASKEGVEKVKSATVSAIRKEGKAKSDKAQQRFETKASMKVARRTGKISSKVMGVRNLRKAKAVAGAIAVGQGIMASKMFKK